MVRVSEPYDNSGSSDAWSQAQHVCGFGETAVLSLSALNSFLLQVIRPVPSLGVLGELLLVFLEYEVVELTALARVPLEMYPLIPVVCIRCKSQLFQGKLFLIILIWNWILEVMAILKLCVQITSLQIQTCFNEQHDFFYLFFTAEAVGMLSLVMQTVLPWCRNLRLTLCSVTVACCQWTGTDGWRAVNAEQVLKRHIGKRSSERLFLTVDT